MRIPLDKNDPDWSHRLQVARSLQDQRLGCWDDRNLIMSLLIIQIQAIETIQRLQTELNAKGSR